MQVNRFGANRWWLIILVPLLLMLQWKDWQIALSMNFALLDLSSLQMDVMDLTVCQEIGITPQIEKRLLMDLPIVESKNRILVHRGRLLWLTGDCQGAIDLWMRAYLKGEQTAAHELLRIGEVKAFSSKDRIVLAENALSYAEDLVDEQRIPAALMWYERAFRLIPQEQSALALATLTQGLGEDDARNDGIVWERLVEELPDSEAAYWWAQAELHALNDDWADAASAYIRGSDLSQAPYDFWIRIGIASERVPDWGQASSAFEQALQLQPDSVWPYLYLGHVYRLQGQYDQALDWYVQAEAKAPGYSDPSYFQGVTYYLMEDYDLAQRYLQSAIEASPRHVAARYLFAQVFYATGNLDLAEEWLAEAISMYPDPPVSWWMQLGDWQLEQGKCAAVRDSYLTAEGIGADEMAIQSKLIAVGKVCDPE